MSDLNVSTSTGGYTPAAPAAPRPQNPYQQPAAAAYRPPVIMGQGGSAPAPQAASQPVVKSRDSISPEQLRAGDKAQQLSLVFGLLATFVFAPVFGPLAIWQGNKAEALDRYGNAGRMLGWIAIVFWLLTIVAVVVAVMLLANLLGTSPLEALAFLVVAYFNPQALSQATV